MRTAFQDVLQGILESMQHRIHKSTTVTHPVQANLLPLSKFIKLRSQNRRNMSTSELQNQIISKVTSITDEQTLEEIFRLVNKEAEMDTIYKLTEEEKEAIEIGLEDVRAGRVYSSEEADKMLKGWLKK
jgi:hypothetical protein